LSIRWLIRHLG